jgi:hypothetical protein
MAAQMMRQASEHLLIDTGGIGLTEITARIAAWVSSQGIGTGLLLPAHVGLAAHPGKRGP